jgi:hypothetical protein
LLFAERISISSRKVLLATHRMPPSRVSASLHSLATLLRSSECSSHSLTAAAIDAAKTSMHGCFSEICEDAAYRAALAADKRFGAKAALGRLDGIPFAIKDNFCTEFGRTTARCSDTKHKTVSFMLLPLLTHVRPQLTRSVKLQSVLQRDCSAAAARCRRCSRWKNCDGRVRHGLFHPQ